jgi:hypothetical protein
VAAGSYTIAATPAAGLNAVAQVDVRDGAELGAGAPAAACARRGAMGILPDVGSAHLPDRTAK